ncbi:MAG: glycoside hydrolase family 31 protein [Verrucomicrobia bacterium]|nr:glycoside hydrolase family 31 protein [Verrucomicrobiota bacterium]
MSKLRSKAFLLEDEASIFHRVETVKFEGLNEGRFKFSCEARGLRPAVTDSKGALSSKMIDQGTREALRLTLEWVDPSILRVSLRGIEDQGTQALPFLLKRPEALREVTAQTGEAPLHCLRDMGKKRGFQTVEEPTPFVDCCSAQLRARVFLSPYRLEINTLDGAPVCAVDGPEGNAFSQNDDPGLAHVTSGKDDRSLFTTSFDLAQDEAIYGYGERFRTFGHNGTELNLSHGDALGTTTERTYKNIPFFISSKGYGVYFDTAGTGRALVGSKTSMKHTVCFDEDRLEYYIIHGPQMTDVLRRYTGLTGRASLPPHWSFGMWMSRCTYGSAEEVEGVVNKLRDHKIGVDVVNLDPGWMDKENYICNLEFNPEGFPDPAAFMRRLRDQGVRICLWQLPYVEKRSSLYPRLAKQNVYASGSDFAETVIDYSKPEAVEVMRKEFLRLFALGAAVIKTDFGEEAPIDGQFAGGSGRFMHNMYPFLYNQAVFEYTKEATGDGLVWARSAWAGSQRHPLHWGGDATSNFPNLAAQIVAALNLGMSGFTFWSSDIAGITGVPTPELYIRWTQFGVFNTHMRYHSGFPVEPWNYGEEAEGIVRDWIDLRYRLLPYIYAQARRACADGLPMMRPMALVNQDDLNVRELNDQFYFGEDLLIAPVLAPGNSRRVYLPAGKWYGLSDGQPIDSPGQWITWEGSLHQCPVYVRAGAIIPLGPQRLHTGDAVNGPITLLYYPGSAGETLVSEPGEDVSVSHKLTGSKLELQFSGREIVRPWTLAVPSGESAVSLGNPLLPACRLWDLPAGKTSLDICID